MFQIESFMGGFMIGFATLGVIIMLIEGSRGYHPPVQPPKWPRK
jgi:hypothetical protein